jgi:prepilin-type N-terminal cleavage/methylation domain-containing protein
MERRTGREPRIQAGFSLIELVVVLAVIGLLALWGIPAFLNTLNRTRLVNSAREIATLMQVGRLEAIKKGGLNGDLKNRVAAVRYDGAGTFQLVVDETPDSPTPLWNPIPKGGAYHLPTGVFLQAPTEAIEGAKAIDAWDTDPTDSYPGPIFLSDGSAEIAGAFRIADTRGNYLEVRIAFPATGKVVIQKWFGGGDPDTNWYENGEGGNHWQW